MHLDLELKHRLACLLTDKEVSSILHKRTHTSAYFLLLGEAWSSSGTQRLQGIS